MPVYHYRAVQASGQIVRGIVEAAHEAALADFLRGSGQELIAAKAKPQKNTLFYNRRRPSLRCLAAFAAQMADLLGAGMPLLDVLNEMAAQEKGLLRFALVDVAQSLQHGMRLSAAFKKYPALFSAVFVAILQSGEAHGNMAEAFRRLATYLEKRAVMQEKLRRAVRYPLFLLIVALAVTSFMMILVVPQIVAFLESIDSQLPAATRALIALSSLFEATWWMACVAFLAIAFVLIVARHLSAKVAYVLDGVVLRVPVLGRLIKQLMLARFAQSLAVLMQGGLGILDSLASARATLGNRWLEAETVDAQHHILAGASVSKAMDELFPSFAVRLLRVGEQGGDLSKSFNDIARLYEHEAGRMVESLIGMLEPVLTLMVGALLAWVVLTVLGPVYGSLAKLNVLG